MSQIDGTGASVASERTRAPGSNSSAVVSLVLGILGVTVGILPLFAFYLGPAALIVGIQSWRAANRGAPKKGMAVAGTALGGIVLAWAIVGSLIMGGAIPR